MVAVAGLQESSSGEVHIEGVGAETLRMMLQHMYGISISITEAEVVPLFEV